MPMSCAAPTKDSLILILPYIMALTVKLVLALACNELELGSANPQRQVQVL